MPSEGRSTPAQFVVIGNPRSRRIAAVCDAARRVVGIEPHVLPYPEVIADRSFVPPEGSFVRLESPGECEETAKRILTVGIEPMEARRRIPLDRSQIEELSFERGAMLHPLQWYLGFERLLTELEERWGASGIRWMSSPSTIALTFDKLSCLERWSEGGLPVPHRPVAASTYAEIRNAIPDRHARLFVKLRYGYSAMGAVALEWQGPRVRAITTVEVTWSLGRPRLFVSKRPRVLTREFEIAWLIDTLGMEEILVEEWLPKARWHGRPFDLRLVTIGQKVQHVVGRAGTSPFTNLNLDAKRIGRAEVVEEIGDDWRLICDAAERAAELLPEASVLGLDLLIRPCRRRFALLEANAFGDYLPGLMHNGLTTYEAEFRHLFAADEVLV